MENTFFEKKLLEEFDPPFEFGLVDSSIVQFYSMYSNVLRDLNPRLIQVYYYTPSEENYSIDDLQPYLRGTSKYLVLSIQSELCSLGLLIKKSNYIKKFSEGFVIPSIMRGLWTPILAPSMANYYELGPLGFKSLTNYFISEDVDDLLFNPDTDVNYLVRQLEDATLFPFLFSGKLFLDGLDNYLYNFDAYHALSVDDNTPILPFQVLQVYLYRRIEGESHVMSIVETWGNLHIKEKLLLSLKMRTPLKMERAFMLIESIYRMFTVKNEVFYWPLEGVCKVCRNTGYIWSTGPCYCYDHAPTDAYFWQSIVPLIQEGHQPEKVHLNNKERKHITAFYAVYNADWDNLSVIRISKRLQRLRHTELDIWTKSYVFDLSPSFVFRMSPIFSFLREVN